MDMEAGRLLTIARQRAGLTLRELAARSGTSHSTLAAYGTGRVVPSVATMDRIVRAAGLSVDARLERRVREANGLDRGEELAQVLELAEQFPARHSPTLRAPVFGRAADAGPEMTSAATRAAPEAVG